VNGFIGEAAAGSAKGMVEPALVESFLRARSVEAAPRREDVSRKVSGNRAEIGAPTD